MGTRLVGWEEEVNLHAGWAPLWLQQPWAPGQAGRMEVIARAVVPTSCKLVVQKQDHTGMEPSLMNHFHGILLVPAPVHWEQVLRALPAGRRVGRNVWVRSSLVCSPLEVEPAKWSRKSWGNRGGRNLHGLGGLMHRQTQALCRESRGDGHDPCQGPWCSARVGNEALSTV